MKKKLLGSLLGLLFVFSLDKNVLAFCQLKSSLGSGCAPSQTLCGDNQHCCDNTNDCSQYPSNSSNQTSQLTSSNSDPTCEGTGINTAIGCIKVLGSQEEFLGDLLKWAIGVGSGVAFLLIVYAGFMIMSSSGNPERLKAGQELLTSALSGLVLLVLSVFILNFIGVKVLQIPGFADKGENETRVIGQPR